MQLTIATYNIHRCYGTDRRFDPQRIARVLRELEADVIALQEVETRVEGGIGLLEGFARECGMTPIPGPTLFKPGAHYGNALLTRLAILDDERIDLSFPGREPRGAIDVRLDAGADVLRICATHLGLNPVERRAQVRILLEHLAFKQGAIDVLTGDLNEWFLWGRPLRWLHRYFEHTRTRRTFPSRLPLFALDRLWVRPRRALRRLEAHRSCAARVASDHLRLLAVIDARDPGGAGFSR